MEGAPCYDGVTPFSTFKLQLYAWMKRLGVEEAVVRSQMRNLLKGWSRDVYDNIEVTVRSGNLDFLMSTLDKAILTDERRDNAQKTLKNIKQRNMSVMEFYEKCKNATLWAFPNNDVMQEYELKKAFVKGLRSPLREKVLMCSTETSVNALKLAQQAEWSKKLQKKSKANFMDFVTRQFAKLRTKDTVNYVNEESSDENLASPESIQRSDSSQNEDMVESSQNNQCVPSTPQSIRSTLKGFRSAIAACENKRKKKQTKLQAARDAYRSSFSSTETRSPKNARSTTEVNEGSNSNSPENESTVEAVRTPSTRSRTRNASDVSPDPAVSAESEIISGPPQAKKRALESTPISNLDITDALHSLGLESGDSMFATPELRSLNTEDQQTNMEETPKRSSNNRKHYDSREKRTLQLKNYHKKQLLKMKPSQFEFDPMEMNTVESMVTFLEVARNFLHMEISEVRRHIVDHLTAELEGPKKSPAEMKKRQLCRMPIHIFVDGVTPDKHLYGPIDVVYHEAFCVFMEWYDRQTIHLMHDNEPNEMKRSRDASSDDQEGPQRKKTKRSSGSKDYAGGRSLAPVSEIDEMSDRYVPPVTATSEIDEMSDRYVPPGAPVSEIDEMSDRYVPPGAPVSEIDEMSDRDMDPPTPDSENISDSQVNAVIDHIEEPSFLLIENRSTDCFLIAILNMMFRCIELRHQLQTDSSSGRYVDLIKHKFNNPDLVFEDVGLLRSALPYPLNTDQHQDCGEVFSAVTVRLQEEVKEMDSVTCVTEIVSTCGNVECDFVDTRKSATLITNLPAAGGSFQSAIDEFAPKYFPVCPNCDQRTVNSVTKWDCTARYHIIAVGRNLDYRFSKFCVNETVSMLGQTWKPIGFVEYRPLQKNGEKVEIDEETGKPKPQGSKGGHYVSWIEDINDSQVWHHVNDRSYERAVPANQLFLSDFDVNVILLKRMENGEIFQNDLQDNGEKSMMDVDVAYSNTNNNDGLPISTKSTNRSTASNQHPETPKRKRNEIDERAWKLFEEAVKSPPGAGNFNANLHGCADDIAEALAFCHGDNLVERVGADEGGIVRARLGKMTLARRCSETCPVMDVNEAAVVRDVVLFEAKRLQGTVEEFKLKSLQYKWAGESRMVLSWLDKYENCYQGLRSLKKRYRELEKLIDLASYCDHLIATKDCDAIRAFSTLKSFSDGVRQKFLEAHMPRRPETQHYQENVMKLYGDQMKDFAAAMTDLEDQVCDVCQNLNAPSQMATCNKSRFANRITRTLRHSSKEQINVCRTCRRAKGMPAGASANMFEPEDVPEELSCLNVLESMLIERARANMKIIFLNSVAKKRTPMKATSGVLVVLPTEISNTLKHVAETLPSGANLNLQVRTEWGKNYVVSMPKVVRALKWLKLHNEHYRDIIIDPSFNFTIGENVFFVDNTATQQDADSLILRDKNSDDGHLLTQDIVEEQPIQRVHQQNDPVTVAMKYLLRKHQYSPVPVDTKNLDVYVFPKLHPTGTTGLDAKRTTVTKFSKYVRNRLRHRDRRWASNANYLCYMFGRKLQLMLTSVQGIQARIRCGMQEKDFDITDEKTLQSMTSCYAKCRGFPQYWKAVKFMLRSHVAAFGPPTWFLTLNPNIKGWTDLHRLYERLTGATNINADTIEQAVANDPIIFARYWRRRVDAFFENVLLRPNGPLGTVTHHFRRVEYQHRGTQHVHCLLWTKDRPTVDSTPAEVEKFLDAHVTARLPDKDKEKELYDLLVENQFHYLKHSGTCRRVIKKKGRFRMERCRFGFPRPVLRRTFVYGDESRKYSVPGVTNRTYFLARREEEIRLNDYNAAIMLNWRANIDVQYISPHSRDVVNYVTAYTTKGEKAKRMTKENVDRYALAGMSKQNVVFNIGHDFLKSRESGLLEVGDDLMGHEFYCFDMAHVFIPTDPKNNRQRILKPQAKRDKNACVHEASWLDDFYPNRTKELSNHSLFNVMANFEIVTPDKNSKTRRNRPISDDEQKPEKKKTSRKRKYPSDSSSSDEDDDDERKRQSKNCKDTIGDDRYNLDCRLSPFYCHPSMESGGKLSIVGIKDRIMRRKPASFGVRSRKKISFSLREKFLLGVT